MARVSRFVLQDVAHHVVARGNNRARIFRSGYDKAKYLKRFAQVAAEEQVLVHGYCLMNNHVHWLLTPTTSKGLARLFQRVHTWWAMVFNRKYDHSGHLFQSRYHSSPLSESHYWSALRYIELNPRKAGLVRRPQEWEFSSARAHLSGRPDPGISLVPAQTKRHFSIEDWHAFLRSHDDPNVAILRRAIRTSKPAGESSWIAQLEQLHQRRLAPHPPGRPSQLQNLPAVA